MAPEGGVCVCVCTYPCMLSGPPNRGEDAWDSVTSVKFLCPHLIPPILHCYHVELVQCVPLINLGEPFAKDWASLVAQMVKNPPAMPEIWVQSLAWEDPLEGHDNPFQYSCLENPTDRGAWRAAVHRVAKSQTQLRLTLLVTFTSQRATGAPWPLVIQGIGALLAGGA